MNDFTHVDSCCLDVFSLQVSGWAPFSSGSHPGEDTRPGRKRTDDKGAMFFILFLVGRFLPQGGSVHYAYLLRKAHLSALCHWGSLGWKGV